MPTYHFADLEDFRLPLGCRLVGVEITDDAIELPSFRHPRQAAYILGAEREGLSADVQSRCDYVVKIPTRFSVNLGVAGALIMYDRLLSLGRHAAPAGRRGRADRGRAAAGVRRPDLQAQAARPRARRPGADVTRKDRRGVVLGLMAVQALALHLMGRVWICSCGTIRLWVGDIRSSELSQQLFDWYTPSHVVHGILFYGLLHLLLPRAPVLVRLAIAVGIEVAWEIAENSPWVIEAYRKQALAAGYTGDSILNSLSGHGGDDDGLRARPPAALEGDGGPGRWCSRSASALLVHDNLTLNILNFIHRFPAIEAWQMRASSDRHCAGRPARLSPRSMCPPAHRAAADRRAVPRPQRHAPQPGRPVARRAEGDADRGRAGAVPRPADLAVDLLARRDRLRAHDQRRQEDARSARRAVRRSSGRRS